jgi:hypothetical protein
MSGKRHFVVERLNWRACEEESRGRKVAAWARLPGSERVASFDDIDAAETDCRRREEEFRREVNPFACATALCYLTSLDEGRLRDWMLDAGLTPPKGSGAEAWRAWWAKATKTMNVIQRAKMWAALDRLQFFRVVETSRKVLFMVAGAYWKYNDEYHYRETDGLTPYKAFRTREAAEEERADMEEFAREEMDLHPFQINGLCDWQAWSSLPQAEAVKRVEALGLVAPGSGWGDTLGWEDWWDETEMTLSQREAVWDLLDKIRFWEGW